MIDAECPLKRTVPQITETVGLMAQKQQQAEPEVNSATPPLRLRIDAAQQTIKTLLKIGKERLCNP